jgi:hypothetical protein
MQIQPMCSFAAHTGGIWDICSFCVPSATAGCASSDDDGCELVSGCATAGMDGIIRFWDLRRAADALPLLSYTTAGK